MELNKIYNMDCEKGLELMITDKNLIDGVITSPPYNIIRPNSTDRGYDKYKDGMSNEQYINWTIRLFDKMDKVIKPNGKILYNMSYGCENTECMNLTVAEIIKKTNFTLADIIVWKKYSATPNNVSQNRLTRICEFIYVFCRKDEKNTFVTAKNILKQRTTGQNIFENTFNFIIAKNNDESCELNKANFSTDLVNQLIKIYFSKGDVIADIFMGTGTTAISCIKNGINYIGFELSTKQCEWAENRIKKVENQFTLDI